MDRVEVNPQECLLVCSASEGERSLKREKKLVVKKAKGKEKRAKERLKKLEGVSF